MKQNGSLARRILEIVAVAFLYAVLGKIGQNIAVQQVTAVWPPSGLALVAVLVLGYRIWPGVWVGSFLLNSLYLIEDAPLSFAAAAGMATGAAAECVLGAFLLVRFASGADSLNRARDVFLFAALAGVAGTALAATFGCTSLLLGGFLPAQEYGATWLTWWMGDLAGIVVAAPFLLAWRTTPQTTAPAGSPFEAVALVTVTCLLGWFAFGDPFSRTYPVEYMLIPCLLWAAFRFGQRGATTLTVIVSALALWGTVRGVGPFHLESRNESLLMLQAFTDVIAMTALVLCAVLRERAQRTVELQRAMREAQQAHAEAFVANQSRNVFLSNMSHELRTPLNHIIGYSDLLCEEGGDQAWLPDLRKINESGKQLLGKISQILDLSTLEADRLQLAPTQFELAPFVEEIRVATQPLAAKNGNTVCTRIAPELRAMEADRERVRQVLLNVIENACKFTKDGRVSVDISSERD